jgi:hypothetical protein
MRNRTSPRFVGLAIRKKKASRDFSGEAMNSPINDQTTEPRTVVSTREARQGVTGHNVRYVLGIGLAAIIVIFGALWLVYFA